MIDVRDDGEIPDAGQVPVGSWAHRRRAPPAMKKAPAALRGESGVSCHVLPLGDGRQAIAVARIPDFGYGLNVRVRKRPRLSAGRDRLGDLGDGLGRHLAHGGRLMAVGARSIGVHRPCGSGRPCRIWHRARAARRTRGRQAVGIDQVLHLLLAHGHRAPDLAREFEAFPAGASPSGPDRSGRAASAPSRYHTAALAKGFSGSTAAAGTLPTRMCVNMNCSSTLPLSFSRSALSSKPVSTSAHWRVAVAVAVARLDAELLRRSPGDALALAEHQVVVFP